MTTKYTERNKKWQRWLNNQRAQGKTELVIYGCCQFCQFFWLWCISCCHPEYVLNGTEPDIPRVLCPKFKEQWVNQTF